MNFQIPTVAESGQHSFSSSLEKKGIFSDCGPKINGGKGGGVESNMSKSNRDIEQFYPVEARRSQDFHRQHSRRGHTGTLYRQFTE